MIIGKEERFSLAGGQTLVLTRVAPAAEPLRGQDLLQIVGPTGCPTVIIRVAEGGVSLELAGGPVVLSVAGDLKIEAERLQLHGRDRLSLTSGRDTELNAEESLAVTAKRQSLTATRGDVRVLANDDVRLDGERIRMNC